MAKSRAQRLKDLHSEALQEFNDIQAALREERMQCLEDRRFCYIAGAQWEGPLGDQFENKPRFEFNKVHLAVKRVISEYRNNRITLDFQPKDGSNDDELADACDGLYRADYQSSGGDEAVDTAFEEGVSGGFGAWRLCADYEDEYDDDNDQQRISIEPIHDADNRVFWSLDGKRYDKRDAKRCFVLTPYDRRAYEAEFDDSPETWPHDIKQNFFDWAPPDTVYVAELYSIEEESELVHVYQGLMGEGDERKVTETELEEDEGLAEELAATGYTEVRQKRILKRVVWKYTMSGGKIFDKGDHKPQRIAGTEIPVIPFYGMRQVVDGIERCNGHVRLAKDAQRLYNMLLSWLAQLAAEFGPEVPIMAPEQVARHATMWAEHNIKRFPYLLADMLIDPTTGQKIPGSQAPAAIKQNPNVPPAIAALAQMAVQALDDMLGNAQAGEEMQPNISGKTVELIQTRLDMQVYIYLSNLARSRKREGEVWLSMMKDIAVEEGLKRKTVAADGATSSIVLNQPAHDPETGEDYVENDMSKANFDVVPDVGPSSSSRRAATVRELTAMKAGTQDPETLAVLDNLILMNMEGEGVNDAREWARRKLVHMGVVKPTKEEAAEMQAESANAPPDPNAQYLQAAAAQALADAGKSRAQTVQTIADADLKRAQTAKTYADTMGAHNDQVIASYQALQQMLQPPDLGGRAA